MKLRDILKNNTGDLTINEYARSLGYDPELTLDEHVYVHLEGKDYTVYAFSLGFHTSTDYSEDYDETEEQMLTRISV